MWSNGTLEVTLQQAKTDGSNKFKGEGVFN